MDEYIPPSIETPEQLKHYKHAEAQRRVPNLEKTHEKARQRMQLLRSRAPRTAESMANTAEKRCARDADYRESCPFTVQVAQKHNLRGAEHLPGIAVEYAQLQKRDRVKEKGGGRAAKVPTC
ncbi:hypothetical protein B0H14DRAFT_2569044 [Mycena olivaceomarginata]|nr:hypothetical protein B0H14DRAFT_2569044 [Mycena olivaceomarginata]